MARYSDSTFWQNQQNVFIGMTQYHDHSRALEKFTILKVEKKRVIKACDNWVDALREAVNSAERAKREGDKAYLQIWYEEVCDWRDRVKAKIARIVIPPEDPTVHSFNA
ncbi:hypothetical protein BJV82DRAFT_661686 [Fennellomyces sp. T-0311]|nr:hypothetical protein BJV82DRAFT_661686 [Fennellomyces sp. T-0311]